VANLTRIKAEVAIVYPDGNIIRDYVAAVAIEAGQPVYIDSNGKVALSDANDAAAEHFRGIALKDVAAGQAVSVMISGWLAGTGAGCTALAYDAIVYVSNDVGELADAAGGTSLQVGRVVPVADKDKSKVLYVTGYAG
jgi:predicted RecA/RadA family phage recombinase